jgi:hypothetical protein
MTPDDTPVPNDDPVARAARRGLGEIAGSDAPGELSWVAVQSGARRIRQRRLAALAVACAIVVVAASAALAAGRNDDRHVRVAGVPTSSSTTTTEQPTAPTTSTTTTATTTSSTTTSTTPLQPGGGMRWIVTKTGGVGPLQLGVSTEAEVRAAAGPPDGTGRSKFGVTGYPDFQALGYDCFDQADSGRLSLHPQPNATGPYCRTVFYVNVDTGTLAGFNTTSNRYETEHGVSVGTSSADAAQREGQAPVSGCFQGIALGDLTASPYELFIWVGTQPTDAVTSISAEAASNQVGLMFC